MSDTRPPRIRSLFVRISLNLLLILLALGGAQLAFFSVSWGKFMEESEQIINASLAEELSVKLRPALTGTIDYAALTSQLSDFQSLNSHFDVFILDASGTIMSFVGERSQMQATTIDLSPIRQYLEPTTERRFPLYGENPRNLKRPTVFSVAEIPLGAGSGYLYVTLFGNSQSFIFKAIQERALPFFIGSTLAVTLALAAIVGVLSFFVLTRRFKNMAVVVQRFERGDYSVRVRDPKGDEVAALSATFDTMADTIVANMDALREKDELRRELVQNISHDLRTPLTAVLGYLETIEVKSAQLSETERNELLHVVVENVEHLKEMIDELFELSKLDAKERIPEFRSFELDAMLQAIALKFQPLAESRSLSLSADPSEHPLTCWGDVSMLSRAISNLVENALRYCKPGGSVHISAVRGGSHTTIHIRDTGIGIPQEDLQKIFDRFFRSDEGKMVHRKGSGLGLAIVQKIVELHDATVTVESIVNQGSTFSFAIRNDSANHFKQSAGGA